VESGGREGKVEADLLLVGYERDQDESPGLNRLRKNSLLPLKVERTSTAGA